MFFRKPKNPFAPVVEPATALRKPAGGKRTAVKPSRLERARRWLRSDKGQAWTSRKLPGVIIAAVAGYISYGHIRHGAIEYGHMPTTEASLLPIGIDGLLVLSMAYMGAPRLAGKIWGYTGFLLGAAMTLAANVLAAPDTTMGRAWNAVPALGVIVAGGMLHFGDRKPRRRRQRKLEVKDAPATQRSRSRQRRTAGQPATA